MQLKLFGIDPKTIDYVDNNWELPRFYLFVCLANKVARDAAKDK
jgi:hypothetical protein